MNFIQSTWKAWVAGLFTIASVYLSPEVVDSLANDLGTATGTAVTTLVAGALTWVMTYLVPNKQ